MVKKSYRVSIGKRQIALSNLVMFFSMGY